MLHRHTRGFVACVRRMRSFSSASATPIGFIGLGNMGGPMANNLLKAGFPVVVHDKVQAAVDTAVKNGASVASSPQELAKQTKIVVTMLPASQHVQQVYLEAGGIFDGAAKGTLFIDSSTIDTDVARKVSGEAQSRGFRMVDAPVSGGITAATSGELTFMVGGEAENFEDAKTVLSHMGRNIVHCGSSGSGQTAKVCNNLLLGISMIGVAEAMNLGIRKGMDAKKLADVINTSSGYCWSSQKYNPVPGVLPNIPASNNYDGGFLCDLMKKDLTLAREAATGAGVPSPLGANALKVYEQLSANGYGKKDFAVIFQDLKSKNRGT